MEPGENFLASFPINRKATKGKNSRKATKGYGKTTEPVLRNIIQRNKNGTYKRNAKQLQSNHKTLKKLEAKCAKLGNVGCSLTKKNWISRFTRHIERSYNIQKEPWEIITPSTGPYVLEIAPMPTGFDIDLIKTMVTEYLTPRLNFYKDAGRSLFVEDEFSEWFLAKATAGKEIGKGHIAMNVRSSAGDGIDAFCVIMNKGESNEKSLIQNFKECGKDLDTLFSEQKFAEATNLFMTNYKKKLIEVSKVKEINNLYYLGFVSDVKSVYLVNFKINIDHIDSVGVKTVTKSLKSIMLNNFMLDEHGSIKLYKSKKRIELRLRPAVLKNDNVVKIYELPEPISDGSGDTKVKIEEEDDDEEECEVKSENKPEEEPEPEPEANVSPEPEAVAPPPEEPLGGAGGPSVRKKGIITDEEWAAVDPAEKARRLAGLEKQIRRELNAVKDEKIAVWDAEEAVNAKLEELENATKEFDKHEATANRINNFWKTSTIAGKELRNKADKIYTNKEIEYEALRKKYLNAERALNAKEKLIKSQSKPPAKEGGPDARQ